MSFLPDDHVGRLTALESWREQCTESGRATTKEAEDRAKRLEDRVRWALSLIITPVLAAICAMVVLYFKVDRIDNYGSQFGTSKLNELNTKDESFESAIRDLKYDIKDIKKALGIKEEPRRLDQ